MSIFSFLSPKKPKEVGNGHREATPPERRRRDSVREPHTPPASQSNAYDATTARQSSQDTYQKLERTRSHIAHVRRKLSKRNLSSPVTGTQPTKTTYRLEPASMPAPLVVKESPGTSRPGIPRHPTVPLLHEGQIKASTEVSVHSSSRPSTPAPRDMPDNFASRPPTPSTPPSPSPAPRDRPAPYPYRRIISDHPQGTPSRLKSLRRTISQTLPKLHRQASRSLIGQTQPQTPAGISLPYNSGPCWDASSDVPSYRYDSMRTDKREPMLM
jgi:hypothetical protein